MRDMENQERSATRAEVDIDDVERAFRAFNSDLGVRPIRHRRADRVKAHLLQCMLTPLRNVAYG